jgi:PAS domain S-box-containing protein
MAMGVMVILESALIGYAARILLKPQLNPPSPSRLYALGAAVHLVMLALMFTLPKEAGLETFRRVGLTVIIAYPLATILAGSILSDHLRAERGVAALRESDERFKLSMEATSDGLWDLDLDSDVSYFNPAYYAILGYETGDFPATGSAWRSRVHPDDLAAAMRANIDCIEGRTDTIDIEYRMKARDGSWRWIRARGKGVQRDAAGKAGRLVGTHVDISSRKAAEEELRRGLEEKEVLLRELHHRVKNNLNVISSLLSLQSSAIRTPEQAMAALLNSKDRVLAMALVHEELYRSNDFSRVNMARYLDDLVRPLLGAYASGDSVAVDIRADEVSLSLNDSIPCGLILNELITNAFKHAFPGGACGRIDVAFSEGESGLLELSVRDTGAGLPLSWEEKARDSLGLTLVRLLVQQLDGTLDIRSDGGTAFRIRFQRKVAV